ncbi:hypothetical protein EDB85DRAFT_1891763 [Lactarius pseudohatsudake]|nr:hypothetical protein EDB85DRAFT_1891763 [Lactarius pseudohatsudake]
MTFGPDFQDKQGEIVATESRLLGNKTSQVRLHEVVILVVGMEMDQEYNEGNICSAFLETTAELHRVLAHSLFMNWVHIQAHQAQAVATVSRRHGVQERGAVGDEREDEERMMSSVAAAVAGVRVEDGESPTAARL